MKQDILLAKADSYAHQVYKLTLGLPREELFGISSQLRRAALSVPLNIIEGYARQSIKSQVQFLRVSYGSLKEAQYLIGFAVSENLLEKMATQEAMGAGEELGRILWTKTKTLEAKIRDQRTEIRTDR